jgi:hypothetical protein
MSAIGSEEFVERQLPTHEVDALERVHTLCGARIKHDWSWWQIESQRLGTDWKSINVLVGNVGFHDDPDDDYAGLTHSFARLCRLADAQVEANQACNTSLKNREFRAPISTLRAARYLIQQNGPKRLDAWLLEHSERERAHIIAHIRGKA